MKYFIAILVTVIVTVVLFSVIQASVSSKMKEGDLGPVVRLETVELSNLTEFITAPGEIEPKRKVDISAKVSARIMELPFEEGDTVTAGDPSAAPPVSPSVLIRLDAKEYESKLQSTKARYNAQQAEIEVKKARLASVKASLKGTNAALEQARKDFDRQKQLLASKDISQSDFDNVQKQLDEFASQVEAAQMNIQADELSLVVAEHNLDAQRAEIDQAQEAVEYTIIRSPMDGTVTRINAEVGEVVMTGTMNNAGTVIMTVADLSQMLVVAQVDEANIGKLALGQSAKVRVQAFWDQTFEGVVDKIALTHDLSRAGAKYYRTEILLQGDVSQLYSGLTADVDIHTNEYKDIIKVPSQAVLSVKIDDLPLDIRENNPNVDTKKTANMVVYRFIDGKAVVTPVRIGTSDSSHIIIESGLDVGDHVIIGPFKNLEGLKHDQKVRDERVVEEERNEKEAKTKDSQKPSEDPDSDDQEQ